MRKIICCVIILTYLALINSSIFSKLKENNFQNIKSDKDRIYKENYLKRIDRKDVELARKKVEVFKILKSKDAVSMPDAIKNYTFEKQIYRMDPVLNIIKRNLGGRRKYVEDSESISSTSNEGKNWKEEWKEHWLMKKLEAVNSSLPKGDMVNMVAASIKTYLFYFFKSILIRNTLKLT